MSPSFLITEGTQYDVNYFLRKLGRIPARCWSTFTGREGGKRDVFGHCGYATSGFSGELRYLCDMFSQYYAGLADVNNTIKGARRIGVPLWVARQGPRARIMAVLRIIKEKDGPGKKKATRRLLRECAKLGIKRVCIGVSDPRVPESMYWAKNIPHGVERSVFQWPTDKKDECGYPAIWAACKKAGVAHSGGNHAQYEYNVKMDTGYYFFHKGVWKKGETRQKEPKAEYTTHIWR